MLGQRAWLFLLPLIAFSPLIRQASAETDIKCYNADFYGRILTVCYAPSDYRPPPKLDDFGDAYHVAKLLTRQLIPLREEVCLNDWGALTLSLAFVRSIPFSRSPDRPSEMLAAGTGSQKAHAYLLAGLLRAFGYDCILADYGQEVLVGFSALQNVYNTRLLRMKDRPYYLLRVGLDRGGLVEMTKTGFAAFPFDLPLRYGESSRPLDLRLDKMPCFPRGGIVRRTVEWAFKGRSYTLEAGTNSFAVRFLKDYPLTDIAVRMNAPATPEVHGTVISALRDFIQERRFTPVDTANFLLAFFYKAVRYVTDEEQFDKSEYLAFAEQTLATGEGDCDDSSILMSVLFRELGFERIGVGYPNHSTIAVHLTDGYHIPGGHYVDVSGKRFYLVDPSYRGGAVGQVIPRYANVGFKIIRLE